MSEQVTAHQAETDPRGHARSLLTFIPLALIPMIGVGFWFFRQAEHDAVQSGGGLQPLPVLSELPAFSLTERSGQTITKDSLDNQVWIADFIFTYCAGPCPRMTAGMVELQKRLSDVSSARLVTFTVDPDRDTPEVLSKYADEHGADKHRWLFLTGAREAIESLAVNGFKMGSVENPMNHSTRFVLVDGEGRVRGYYDLDEPDGLSKLENDVRTLVSRSQD
jgi:cytochrome oxidase Cu insertion factor (SCO1/SenC/PrrC family)